MDLISVVVPIYNLDVYLHQCVSSIVGQTYRCLEIILVDDGSSDNAPEICEYFRKIDARVKVIVQPNSGLVSARKAGLNAAMGKYVFYVDGDDWIDPDCLLSYHRLALTHDADIVIGDYKREFLGNFLTVRNDITPGVYERRRIERDLLPNMISHGTFFSHGLKTYSWGKLYRRSLILDLQNQVPEEVMVAEDAALFYPAVAHSRTIVISDMALCNYRQRPNSLLKSTNLDQRETERIATAFRYLAAALNSNRSPYGFELQLKRYFAAIVTIRSGAFLSSQDLYDMFKVFGPLVPCARLAVYNSGSFGQHVYRHLQNNPSFSLVGWYDKDYRENAILRMPVSNPDTLSTADFDHLLVPSFDPALQSEVNMLFAKYGLNPAKVRSVSLEYSKLDSFIQALGYHPVTFQHLNERVVP
jgi:glycosyltransferase involved in cell wall biosynthesis